ncbi:ABC transporter substrate-binding protein (plasmid) [Rhizobium sp. B230/85]|uniref:ABC transporter substrate-binding protein n=1 Tax=unclassified Rhizobium TaxID=2613769 RepID=UPI001ADD1887|nr:MULTISPECIES: ABC transporter substrate-binding protein [unclassified Rhizobium]MBO9136735.1 ABC transporter substrate-binding protein [Rhizobium sp. B209b/85]QXZ99588.1 ABC transporter substrate-binding protein [Rhizobium sp. B230/85]
MKLKNPLRSLLLSGLLTMLAVWSVLAGPTQADELRIATSYKLMTLDPLYANLNENTSLLSHIYERLVYQDEHLDLKPGLAVAWRATSDTEWEFKLREHVRFHDGSPFTADDVVYTIERIRDFLKPPSGGFQSYVAGIKSVSAPDPLTVVIDTNGSVPNLPLSFSSIFVMHRPGQGFQTTEDLNAGSPPIGTGPYKFERWSSGEMLKLTRNDDYWGRKPPWSAVTLRVIENPAARVAALTTGDVDIADAIPARDVASLKKRGTRIASVGAARINFLQFDVERETVPGVTSNSGDRVPNPFKNPLVRRALAMATDRGILVDKILAGYGTAAAQVFPGGLPGTSANLKPEATNYDDAKALLAKAGFPNGFNVILAGPTGRYPGDSESLQAIAQSWARIGVTAQPVAFPFSVFNTKRAAGDYAVWYGGTSGEAVDIILNALLASSNPERGTGALNFGHYRNAAFDAMLAKAESVQEGPARNEALADATDFVMADQPIIPLYHFHHIVGYGPRVGSYMMHPRGWTTAMQTLPATE